MVGSGRRELHTAGRSGRPNSWQRKAPSRCGQGMPAGFEMELAQEACQRIKAECEFVALKWDELIPGLLDKKFDIIMSSMEVTRERRQRMGLSRRYYLSPGAFIAPKGAPYDGPPSLLRNKRIGIQKDSTHADWADKSFRRSAQLKRYASIQEALAGLANDEVDAVFGDKAQLASIAWDFEFWQVWSVPITYMADGRKLPSFASLLGGKA